MSKTDQFFVIEGDQSVGLKVEAIVAEGGFTGVVHAIGMLLESDLNKLVNPLPPLNDLHSQCPLTSTAKPASSFSLRQTSNQHLTACRLPDRGLSLPRDPHTMTSRGRRPSTS